MLVFRENRVAVSAHLLVRTLAEKMCAPGQENALDALLRAGELECALADGGSSAANRVAPITDALAGWVVNGVAADVQPLARILGGLAPPTTVRISPPEGFAYYALHPLKYVQLVASLPAVARSAVVVGIRSIGTTLGAIVRTALAQRGVTAERISVRPKGHPFDRVTHFTPEEGAWVERQSGSGAEFFIVDEGPGLSGSSLISAGEALVELGVQRDRIRFLCSHHPQPGSLRARNGAERWLSFRACAVEHNSHCRTGCDDLSAGRWRERIFSNEQEWPSCWPQMERVKSQSENDKCLIKFEGLGRFGAEVWERNRALADAGFGATPEKLHEGFAAYRWIEGRHGRAGEASEAVLSRLADYCAFRGREFGVRSGDPQGGNLAAMARCNVSEEFGIELEGDESLLDADSVILVDGRMQPHEWVQSKREVWLKVDGGSHGDDHFYPGPTDIAWDLAGAIVEWQMEAAAREYFLSRYQMRSGDDPALRLPTFLLAYSAFRLGYCKMASESVGDPGERQRLTRDYKRYRRLLEKMLPAQSLKLQVSSS